MASPKNNPSKETKISQTGRVVYISIDELVIDPCNVRGGAWDYDKEFIQSVKHHGIRYPLLVRPLEVSGKQKYGIVCGSRRYHAAIEAGLREVPCVIQIMSDLEAMGVSLEENVIRKDIPLWQVIESIGKMYEMLKEWRLRQEKPELKTVEGRYREISRRTSLKKEKVRDYVRIYYLPKEVKALLKSREDRTQYEEERLCKILYRTRSPSGILNVFKAKLILEYLNDFPLEKQVEAAAYIIPKTNAMAERIIQKLAENPDLTMWDVEKLVRGETLDVRSRTIRFDGETMKALEKACMHRQKDLSELLVDIIREWLKKNLYL